MFDNSVDLETYSNPDQAPNYGNDWKALNLNKVCIIGQGTTKGNPTVDLQFTDQEGNKCVAMFTGGILEMIAGAVAGVKARG